MLVSLFYLQFNLIVGSQITILNASAFAGRIIPNMLADRFGVYNVAIPCVLSSAVLTFAMTAVRSVTGMIIFAILYGFMSGAGMYHNPWYNPLRTLM